MGAIGNRKITQKIAENCNKLRPKPKTKIIALTDKASVGFRISLLFNFSTSKLVFPRPSLVQNSLRFKKLFVNSFCKSAQRTYSRWEARIKLHNKMIVGHFGLKETPHSEVAFRLPLTEFSFVSHNLQPNLVFHLYSFVKLLFTTLQPNTVSSCFNSMRTEQVSAMLLLR